MTTNFQELRKEIEKGCRKDLIYKAFTYPCLCGDIIWDEVKEIKEKHLCPFCQKALETLNKCEEAFKEMIRSLEAEPRMSDLNYYGEHFSEELLSQFNLKEEKLR